MPTSPKPGPKWRCPNCNSTDVEISLPTWYTETDDGELHFVDIDAEADVLWWYCNHCSESDSGEPTRNE